MASEPYAEVPSDPVERVSLLDAGYSRLSTQLNRLQRVIADMEQLDSLTPPAAALLARYRENELEIRQERARVEFETAKLLAERPEAAREWERRHAADTNSVETAEVRTRVHTQHPV